MTSRAAGRPSRAAAGARGACRRSAAGLAALALLGACGERGPRRPNVILVSIDSLRADHLGCYGYERDTSPRIDRLAAEGVRFETAISTTSWTLPAHAALFTGLEDETHGVVDNGLALAPAHVTLAELLQGAGYRTAGFYGGPYLHPTFGLAQGFELWQSCMSALPAGASERDVRASAMAVDAPSHEDVTGPRTAEAVEAWLARDEREPFFLFLHLWDVHYDYIPPPELVERFDPGYDGPVDGRGVASDPALRAGMPERDLRHLVARYDGEIRFTDAILGRILDALAARGLLEDAVVVVTADHGEEFLEHGGTGHQRTLFDEVVRVPLVVWAPGRAARGAVVAEPVRLIDVLPTIARLAGIKAPLAVQGRDLGPLLAPDAQRAGLAGDERAPPALCELSVNDEALFALRRAGEKLVVDERAGLAQRYDLARDPGERAPAPLADPSALEAARRAARSFGRFLDTRAPGAVEPDSELIETLRRLGYLGGG